MSTPAPPAAATPAVVSAAGSSSDGKGPPSSTTGEKRKLTPDDFQLGRLLGEGSYARVLYGVQKPGGEVFAVKILDKRFVQKNDKVEAVMREKDVMARMQHPNIVRLFHTFSDSHSLYFVIEYAPNGDMFDRIKAHGKFSLAAAQFYAAELVTCIEYMHGLGIVHRDLKPENILFSANWHLKLIDFGTCKDTTVAPKPGRRKSFVGTAEYVSPEALNKSVFTFAMDLWALGCIVYQMLTGKAAFKAATEYLTFQKVINREFTFPDGFDATARDLVNALLDPNPDTRLGCGTNGFAALKAHPFFAGINWTTLPTITPPALSIPVDRKTPDTASSSVPPAAAASTVTAAAAAASATAGLYARPLRGPDSDSEDDGSEPEPCSPSPMAASYVPSTSPSSPSLVPVSISSPRRDGSAMMVGSPPSTTATTAASTSPPPALELKRTTSSNDGARGSSVNSMWKKFLLDSEQIVFTGLVNKKRGLFQRKRQLILTTFPRFVYIDPEKMCVRGEIQWSASVSVEFRSDRSFWVHTPTRIYYFESLSTGARSWCEEINKIIKARKGL